MSTASELEPGVPTDSVASVPAVPSAAAGAASATGTDVAPDDQRARRLFVTLALGFASGLPLALSRGTLTYFLARYGVGLEAVGLFGLVGAPYSYKFVWAPLMDRVDPGPFVRLGRRRGWLLLSQIGLVLSIAATGLTDPRTAPFGTALGAFGIAFFSASQDVVIDALRVETLATRDQGWGAALTTWGYRIGMLASGWGALQLAAFTSFRTIYAIMAALAIVGAIATWLVIEPTRPEAEQVAPPTFGDSIRRALVEPFASLRARHPFGLIAVFLIVYKLGDVWAGHLSNAYLVGAGFSGPEIANVTKVVGVIAIAVGVGLGGLVVSRFSVVRCLPFAALIMAVSNVAYAWLATRGHSVSALMIAVGIENVTSGIGSAITIAWLASLCATGRTATQYALLTALTSMSATHLVALSGFLKAETDGWATRLGLDHGGWPLYFAITAVAGLPGVVLAFVIAMRSGMEHQAPSLPN